jgi:acyl carrier protein
METNTSAKLLTPLEFIQSQVEEPVTADTPLEELDLDSLELLNLQVECQAQFGKSIPDRTQAELHTVGDLASFFG